MGRVPGVIFQHIVNNRLFPVQSRYRKSFARKHMFSGCNIFLDFSGEMIYYDFSGSPWNKEVGYEKRAAFGFLFRWKQGGCLRFPTRLPCPVLLQS